MNCLRLPFKALCIFAGLLLLTGCAQYRKPYQTLHRLFTYHNFPSQQRFDDLTIMTRELNSFEINQLFCNGGQMEEQFRVIHLQVMNNGGFPFTVCPLGTMVATQNDIKRFITPSKTTAASVSDVGVYTFGFGSFFIVGGMLPSDAQPLLFLGTLIGSSLTTAVLRSMFFDDAGYIPVMPYFLLRDADSNPTLTVNPFQEHNRMIFISRSNNTNVLRVSVAGGKHHIQQQVAVELVPPL